VERLLREVSMRQRVASVGARFCPFFFILAGAYVVLVVLCRLLALVPDVLALQHLVALVAGGLALAIAFHRRPSRLDAARQIDGHARTKDLFLTAALLGRSHEEFAPLVAAAAEARAGAVRPAAVVPFRWFAKGAAVTLALAALVPGILYLPQFDPFGKEQQRARIAERQRKLEEGRKATALRVAQLRQKDSGAELSKRVAQAIEELKQTFKAMDPKDQQANLKQLSARQGELGELWRKAAEGKWKGASEQSFGPQRFGSNAEKLNQWRQDLQKGDTQGLNKELAELKDLARKVSETKDEAQKKVLEEELRQRMDQLADFAAGGLNSPSLNAGLQRALEQLAAADNPQLSRDALDALAESLDLSQSELSSLARSARDLQALEKALASLQNAKRINLKDALDGQACAGCMTLDDYAAFYAALLAKEGWEDLADGEAGLGDGEGDGGGMGGKGHGRGGLAPEAPDAKTDFKTEVSKSALTAGKILLSMKTRGVSQAGDAPQQYAQQLDQIKQGVSEAILHEQVPPAYHDAIRQYFDSMETPREGPEGQ
jgi:hypothetical protein